jgi:hypothetical protein
MDTRAAVGLKPVRPFSAGDAHRAAGVGADGGQAMPSVTEMAAPEEEPPGMRPPSTLRCQVICGVP